MSYGFLSLTILLFASVAYLVYQMAKGKQQWQEMPQVFQSEGRNLLCILVFFCSTYFMRFISDRCIIPYLFDNYVNCTLDG